MHDNDTAPMLAQLIEDYLHVRRYKTMAEVAPLYIGVDYNVLVQYHDILGWQNFIKGRFLLYMDHLQQNYLSDRDTWQTAKSWARGLMEQLLCITYCQWLLWNALLHFCLLDDQTIVERKQLILRIQDLMWKDPDDLLPTNCSLLDKYFAKLCAADGDAQAYWAAERESAIKDSCLLNSPERSKQDSPYIEPILP